MRITLYWMREFTPIEVAPAKLAEQLTLAGLEVESLAPAAQPFSNVIVGQVLESKRHPDAEKLSVCEVTTDGENRLTIVCGAKNVRAGLKVAVAMVGAQLPGGIAIKRARLRGIESNGMICSARELGLGEEHEGIMELPDWLPVGRDLREALDLDDSVLEVNATPNRGDCMSVFGIARDYSAAQSRRLIKYPVRPVAPTHQETFPVSLEAGARVPVFSSRIIRGLKPNAPSPAWMRERLRRVGHNSISAIVDVTNYVMLELGQPLHAYDHARLKSGITVRAARQDEPISLLDGKTYTLGTDACVIADASGAIGLAGIMGGAGTAIGAETTDVLLEAAHFTPEVVAARARRLGLLTDAAARFERGVDPTLGPIAIERATALLLDIAGGEPGPTHVTRAPGLEPAVEWVRLRRSRLTRLLGGVVPDAEVEAILRALSETVEVVSEGWRLQRPPHRFDLRIEADLIEEIARLRGFERIDEHPAIAPQVAGFATEQRVSSERLLTALADRDYREAITYSFVDPAVQRALFPGVPALALANPISADLSEMRVSLWSGLLIACRENLRRQHTRVRLFEMGNKFDLAGGVLREIETLAGVATGARWPEQWGSAREALDFYDVKADVTELLALTGEGARASEGGGARRGEHGGEHRGQRGDERVRFEPGELACLRPGRSARIFKENAPIGWLGELHPALQKAFHFANPVLLFELEIDRAFSAKLLQYKKTSKFPSVRRDLAVVVDEAVPLAAIEENVTVSASGLLSELRVFDIYRGPGIDFGRKSIALGLILQDSSRTLTDDDADAVIASVVARLRDVLSATIRDQ
jgi:phenylalanyl-tRNA synthetase beta chain